MSDAPETEAVGVDSAGLEGILTPEQAEEREAEGLPVQEGIERALDANPFGLTDDHEFSSPAPDAQPEVDRVDVFKVTATGTTLLGSGQPGGTFTDTAGDVLTLPAPPPAMPGSAESIYRRCPCIGVMPGRACPRCAGTKWVKTCPKCEGEMTRTVQSRKGAHARTERCGFCMGLGQVPARLSEVREAEEAAKAYVAPPVAGRPSYPRGPQLPGVRQSRQSSFADRAAKKSAGLAKNRRSGRGRQRAS